MSVRALDDQLLADQVASLLPDVVAVYLFGSCADGTARRGSDVDLAVLAPEPLPAEEIAFARDSLAETLGRDVDLLDLRRLSTVMRSQIVSTARLLLDRDPTSRAFFETFVYSSYARLNEERREILKQVKRDGRIHG